MDRCKYLSCVETAKLLRQALKCAFPGVTFSIRSKTYSGGASIDVSWTDGPTGRDVDRIARQFQGSGFDGMIDMKYHVDHWLLPDGSLILAHSPGTTGSGGMVPPESNPEPKDAIRVSFGADHVFTNRTISPGFEEACGKAWEALDGHDRCELLNNPEFPRWPEDKPGARLARFLSA